MAHIHQGTHASGLTDQPSVPMALVEPNVSWESGKEYHGGPVQGFAEHQFGGDYGKLLAGRCSPLGSPCFCHTSATHPKRIIMGELLNWLGLKCGLPAAIRMKGMGTFK